MNDTPDSLADFVVRFRRVADPVQPTRPDGVRVRSILKFALRSAGYVSEGFVDTAPQSRQDAPKRPADGQR